MNYIVLGLAIVIIVLLVVLYMYYTNKATTLVSNTALTKPVPTITINSPTSTRYAYGLWVNIHSWSKECTNIIFSVSNSLVLYLSNNTPVLYCDVLMSDNTTVQTVTITDNFPLQKWTHIIVSMDNQFMDIYMNGKLLISQRLYKPASNNDVAVQPAAPGKDAKVTVGCPLDSTWGTRKVPSKNTKTGTSFDAFITKFIRWTEPMDPQTAWSTYMSGSGNSFSSTTYNLNMNLLKNNVKTSTLTLF